MKDETNWYCFVKKKNYFGDFIKEFNDLAGAAELSKISWSLQRDQSSDHAVTDSDAWNPLGWYTHLLGRTAGQ